MTREEMLIAFLADRDVPCPRCRYSLRGIAAPKCPECGVVLRLSLRVDAVPSADPDAERRWLVEYLAKHGAECPECRLRLHGEAGSACPACGALLTLSSIRQAAVGRSLAVEARTAGLWLVALLLMAIAFAAVLVFVTARP
ncbi:MAG: hypothetical protein DYG93_12645 [Leptolyngbya sp. PLA2]|nr:hypothetical protein [Leptolyngbya sp.]MCE7972493.1 hypothetical protein [Leptolyngbya sp. PL-A2]MCQ3941124.1 hypothetical protein [cyanobacterium CYA1]MCZ7633189.1 hypothetical protein [Phycisphaerales bacterium]MDL1905407.1 hypothetical protein [Synechococcales cyanobacterium CNB]GIK18332.1 MAG: hypothetical protein BroJett004_04960 [Planctomycetota bacterium]